MSAKLTTDQDDVAINGDPTRYRALLKAETRIVSSGAEGMLEQAAGDELLGRLHHVLPHLERSALLVEKCESLFSAHRAALVVPQIASDAKG